MPTEIDIDFIEPTPLTVNFVTGTQGPPGPGGEPIDLALAAWIETTGDDSTGIVGNPAFPYQTLQAAYDAGAKTFKLGEGTFAGLTLSANESLSIEGRGYNKTTVNFISGNFSLTLQDTGVFSVSVLTIDLSGAAAGVGEVGPNGGGAIFTNVFCYVVNLSGGKGGLGTPHAPNGGNSGGLTGWNTRINSTLTASGGAGGNGGVPNGNAGNGGNGSILSVNYSTIGTLQFGGGVAGTPTGSGSAGGTGGTGSFTGVYSEITSIVGNSGGDVYNGTFMFAPTATGSAGIINASKINGVFTG